MARILVADDSLTIQKVVSITLSSMPYQLVPAKNEQELINNLKSDKFDLILLDFGLVEKKSGYDLAKEIVSLGHKGAILALVGTFDSIDLAKLKNSGIGDYITKPFESEKFITKCMALIESGVTDSENLNDDLSGDVLLGNFGSSSSNSPSKLEDDTDQWIVDTSKIGAEKKLDDIEKIGESSGVREIDLSQLDNVSTTESPSNRLAADLEGWGVNVPGVIGKKDQDVTVPPLLFDEVVSGGEELSGPKFAKMTPEQENDLDHGSEDNSNGNSTDVFHLNEFLSNDISEADINIAGSTQGEQKFNIEVNWDLESEVLGSSPGKKPDLESTQKLYGLSENNDTSKNSQTTNQKKEEVLTSKLGAKKSEEKVRDTGSNEDEAFVEGRLPGGQDLEYPDMGPSPAASMETKKNSPLSKLIPLDQLANDEESDNGQSFELPSKINEKLLEQISSDVNPEEFWATDHEETSELPIKHVSDVQDTNEKVELMGMKVSNKSTSAKVEITSSNFKVEQVDPQKIANELFEQVKPILDNLIKDYCKKTVEKVAWDVIPDLAENLIKAEIKKIESTLE